MVLPGESVRGHPVRPPPVPGVFCKVARRKRILRWLFFLCSGNEFSWCGALRVPPKTAASQPGNQEKCISCSGGEEGKAARRPRRMRLHAGIAFRKRPSAPAPPRNRLRVSTETAGQCRRNLGNPEDSDQTSTTSYRMGTRGFPRAERYSAAARAMRRRFPRVHAAKGPGRASPEMAAARFSRRVLTSTKQRTPDASRQTMSSSPKLRGARQLRQRSAYPAFSRKRPAASSPRRPIRNALRRKREEEEMPRSPPPFGKRPNVARFHMSLKNGTPEEVGRVFA